MRTVGKRGFTLIELLLVVMIIGIITATAVPYLVSSIRAARIHAASRAVVSIGRYARGMAVMRQRDLVVVFDMDAAAAWVADPGAPVPAPDAAEPAASPRQAEPDGSAQAQGSGQAQQQRDAMRQFDDVKIVSVEIGGGLQSAGTCSVTYRRNGRCTPYTVSLADSRGKSVRVEVDALGSPRTEEGYL